MVFLALAVEFESPLEVIYRIPPIMIIIIAITLPIAPMILMIVLIVLDIVAPPPLQPPIASQTSFFASAYAEPGVITINREAPANKTPRLISVCLSIFFNPNPLIST